MEVERMHAGTGSQAKPRRSFASCDVIALTGIVASAQVQALKGLHAEACGRIIRLHGDADPATRRLADQLARAFLGADDVRFDDAA
jgi:hypothetical protein